MRGLYNIIESSHDELTLPDFLEFFRRSDETVRRPLARITAKVGNTVTTVAVSLNQVRET